ncbi:MAG: ethanolamine kinase [Myxococcota bacterium]|jgi:ethanolamine kinase
MVYRDTPAACLSCLPIDRDAPDRDARLLDVVRRIAPSWAHEETAVVSSISGGITNLLFLLTAPDRDPMLVRLYGDGTEVVIDRDRENTLMAYLSQQGFAPTFHGRFTGGRVEGYLTGHRPLTPDEMGDARFRPLIAAALRQLHEFPVSAVGLPSVPTLWDTLDRWRSTAMTLPFSGEDAARHAALDLPRYAEHLQVLQDRFHRLIAPRPEAATALRPVLAHNDLLSGNLLYSAEHHAIRLIDYEYSACSYAAFDIANHFCEYAGFDSNFARGFPSRANRDAFIADYLGPGGDVAAFSDVVEFFVVADHLFWGFWSVIQAHHSPIDFDFMGYSRLRLAGFDLHRSLFS